MAIDSLLNEELTEVYQIDEHTFKCEGMRLVFEDITEGRDYYNLIAEDEEVLLDSESYFKLYGKILEKLQ